MKRLAQIAVLSATLAAMLVVASPAGGANECNGLMVCVPIEGPWVVVPASTAVPRPQVAYQLTCPRGFIVGGLDARLSQRAIDVSFLGMLGSPVNPGITTSRSVVFLASYVGSAPRGPTFKPFVGCMPATGGGTRIPTAVSAFPPGRPIVRHVRTVRVRPGSVDVTQGCAAGERLIGASHAFGFYTSAPPSPGLVSSVTSSETVRGGRVVVTVRGDAELQGVRAVVQVHAVCSVVR